MDSEKRKQKFWGQGFRFSSAVVFWRDFKFCPAGGVWGGMRAKCPYFIRAKNLDF